MSAPSDAKTISEASEFAHQQLQLHGSAIPGAKVEMRGPSSSSPKPYLTVRYAHSIDGSVFVTWDVDFSGPNEAVTFRPTVCMTMPAINAHASMAVAFAHLAGQLSALAATLQAQLDGLGPIVLNKNGDVHA